MTTFWIVHEPPPVSPEPLLAITSRIAGWRVTTTSTKGGRPSAPYYESFSSVHILPEAGWTQELAEYHGSMFNKSVTGVELTASDYEDFLSHLEGGTVRCANSS